MRPGDHVGLRHKRGDGIWRIESRPVFGVSAGADFTLARIGTGCATRAQAAAEDATAW